MTTIFHSPTLFYFPLHAARTAHLNALYIVIAILALVSEHASVNKVTGCGAARSRFDPPSEHIFFNFHTQQVTPTPSFTKIPGLEGVDVYPQVSLRF